MSAPARKREFLACLSDPSRFSLVTRLAEGPRCVTELAHLVGLSQSCTTRHLQALLREGIVSGERQGKRVVYRLGAGGDSPHPVLRWACSGAGEGAGPAPATSRKRIDRGVREHPGAPRPASSPGGSRGRPIAPSAEAELEVTDVIVAGFDSAWREAGDAEVPVREIEAGRAGGDNHRSGADREHASAEEPRESSRGHLSQRPIREELDDFLL